MTALDGERVGEVEHEPVGQPRAAASMAPSAVDGPTDDAPTDDVPAPSSASDSLAERWGGRMLANYGTPTIEIAHGRGCTVTDTGGREYIDFVAGIAVSSLGHAHPALVSAVTEQVARIAHTSNLYAHEPGLRLAARLQQMLPVDSRAFFCQDGATAMEAALKIVRRWAYTHSAGGGRQVIVAAEGSFHGRTFGALSVTGSPGKRDPFAPFAHDVRFVPYGDARALASSLDEHVAAVVLEPVQGEAGVVVPPAGYLAAARALTAENGSLLVVDEVQSGVGRTGAWLSCIEQGVVPDIVTLAKGLAGGLPIGALLATGAAMTALVPGDHGSTFGGNPVSCAAALAVIDTIERDGLLQSVRDWGIAFESLVAAVDHRLLAGTRGVGAWQALLLHAPVAAEFEAAAREAGYLVNAVRADVIRLCPPLTVTLAHLTDFVDALPGILESVEGV